MIWVTALARDICCSFGQETLLSQCPSPPEIWVPATLVLGVTLQWKSIPHIDALGILLHEHVIHATKTTGHPSVI